MATTNYRHNETGSLATFIIVGVVLAALLVGGVFLAKQRGIIASNDNGGTEVATQNDANEARQDNEQGSQDDADKGAAQDEATNDQPVEAPADSPATGDGNGEQQDNEGTLGANTDSNDTGTTSQQQSEQSGSTPAEVAEAPRTGGQAAAEIPATGFADSVAATMVAMTALTYGGVCYVRSRRRLSQV